MKQRFEADVDSFIFSLEVGNPPGERQKNQKSNVTREIKWRRMRLGLVRLGGSQVGSIGKTKEPKIK